MHHFLNYLKQLEEKRDSEENWESPDTSIIQMETTMRQRTKRQRTKKKIDQLTTGFIVILLAISAFSKVTHADAVAERLNKVGVGKFMTALGIVELLLAILFIPSRTMRLSFILLSCYFSGAIATEISHGGNFIVPFVFLVLVWVASFIREKSILTLGGNIHNQPDQNPWNVNWMLVE